MSRSEKAEVTVLCMIYDENRLVLQNRVNENWKGVTLELLKVFDSEDINEFIYERNNNELEVKLY